MDGVKESIATANKRGHMESKINKLYMESFKNIVDKLEAKSSDRNLVNDVVNLINNDSATLTTNSSHSTSGDEYEGGEQLMMVSNKSVIKDYRGRVAVAGSTPETMMSSRQRNIGSHQRSSRRNTATPRSKNSRVSSYTSSLSRGNSSSPSSFGTNDFGTPKILEFTLSGDDDSSCTATISSSDDFSLY